MGRDRPKQEMLLSLEELIMMMMMDSNNINGGNEKNWKYTAYDECTGSSNENKCV